ncbi:hypothetical protein CXB51_014940 [Gossypium anomalum]|uniref:Aminotransferase-like plant mobile domain-containing protein n=1 Tax=Gossypium anomalum TaxID=47600 RepID=A0A8J5YS40_9ROSI|nr:hypothetical protein CXB51_014940 [Gossypium anomalum]
MASLIKKDDSYCVLRGRVNGLGYSPVARLMPYLELAGFGSAALTRTFDLRYDLISTLVKRWRPETHTFHLPCGECTVTLEDVALHFGLPMTGMPSRALLGASPGDADSTFSELKFTWLKANFQHLSVNATEEELMCAARAYIMYIIGGVLMPNSSNNKVHLQYLPLLVDLHNVRSYSWGSAVLAVLYRKLCRTTKPDAVDMGGCLILLQAWALYRIPFLASVSHQPYVFLLVNRWSIYPSIGRSYTVPIYRLMIEQHAGEGFQCSRVVPRGSSTTTVWLHPVYRGSANAGGGGSWHQQERETWTTLEGYALEICCGVGESDGSKTSDGYVFQFATIVRRSGAYEPMANIEPDLQSDPEPDPKGEPEAQPEAESEQSHSHSADSSYYPNLSGNDYFSGSSGGRYHYGFDIFGSHPPQHNTSPGPYPPHYSTTLARIHCSTPLLLGCIHRSIALLPAQAPSPATEEDVGRRNHPQRERRPPQKYTPKTTPSNHQF